jgi:competence protein ComEC
MWNKLIWPSVAIICAIIIAFGIYLGLKDSKPQPQSVTKTNWKPEGAILVETTTQPQSVTKTNESDPIVYVTRTGECYHRGSCGYLRKSKIPMKLSEAKKRYRPCSKCRPPQ